MLHKEGQAVESSFLNSPTSPMMRCGTRAWLAATAALAFTWRVAYAEDPLPICRSYKPAMYGKTFDGVVPNTVAEVKIVQSLGLTAWYTDMIDDAARESVREQVAKACTAKFRAPMVVYGMPNKNCDGTTSGTITTINEYQETFLTPLADAVKGNKMLYVLEPGALSLLAAGGCGKAYMMPLKVAVTTLAKGGNADIYLDLDYKTIQDERLLKAAVTAFQDIASTPEARVAGIALNTANYQTNADMVKLCNEFIKAVGDTKLKCVIDTSRNYQGPTKHSQTCNANKGGLGVVPTFKTEHESIAYYLWVKTPGESDGVCKDKVDSHEGPPAGDFFAQYFTWLWDGGYLKENKLTDEKSAVEHVQILNKEIDPPKPDPAPAPKPDPAPAPAPDPAPAPAPEPPPKEEEEEPKKTRESREELMDRITQM